MLSVCVGLVPDRLFIMHIFQTDKVKQLQIYSTMCNLIEHENFLRKIQPFSIRLKVCLRNGGR